MSFESLFVRFERSGEARPWRVARSASGTARGPFGLDFSEIRSLAAGRPPAPRDLGARDAPEAEALPPREIGQLLFRALFEGAAGQLLLRTTGRARGGGLRVELELGLDDPELADLGRLPWELLHDGTFLFADPRNSIVRTVPVARPVSMEAPPGVMIATSSPAGFAPLDTARERAGIETAWRSRKDVRISLLEGARLEDLRPGLRGTKSWILHFIGHGAVEPGTGEAGLIFEGGAHPRRVDGSRLAAQLSGIKVRLIVLNACQTDYQPERRPFAGVATALVQAGLPAVVAMQRRIHDQDAILFGKVFHSRLAAGEEIGAAMAEARLELSTNGRDPLAWSTPVLYVQPGGDLARITSSGGEKRKYNRWGIRALGSLAWLYLGILTAGMAAYILSPPAEGGLGPPWAAVPLLALSVPAAYTGIRCHRLQSESTLWISSFILGCLLAVGFAR